MKIIICIQNHVDTIDVLIDGTKIDASKMTFSQKSKFVCNVETGVHEIFIKKKSKKSQLDLKNVLLDWASCSVGVPDWTLAEKSLDAQCHSIFLKVDVKQDLCIDLKLTEIGFELTKNIACILDISQQTEVYKSAKKRIKYAYILPVIVLVALIELCMLSASVFFLLNNEYRISLIFLVLAIFWAYLVCNMLFKNKSVKKKRQRTVQNPQK